MVVLEVNGENTFFWEILPYVIIKKYEQVVLML